MPLYSNVIPLISSSQRLSCFVLLLLLANIVSPYTGIFDVEKSKCATIYSDSNYNSSVWAELVLKNPQVVADLSEFLQYKKNRRVDFGVPEPIVSWDKNVNSITVEKGCTIKVCSRTHLEEPCAWLNESTPLIPNALMGDGISSLACSCPSENCYMSDCTKVKLRDSECGRVFFEPSCHTCNGFFATLKRNHDQSHFGGYESKATSLVVNEGCSVTIDSEGTAVYSTGSYEDIGGIDSYQCHCDDNKIPKPAPTKPTNLNYPPMINIPSAATEVQELTNTYTKHDGLDSALRSLRHKRSATNAYVLLIGLTGSGKSSTINFLFDKRICDVGSQTSVTESINEYRIPVQVDELGCANCELRIIDTPGFGDTDGMEADAKFLAGLEAFLNTHEELRHKIPNIILIFTKFSDNRIEGKYSSFVKTLRGIELFKERLFDHKYSNILTVLTHFMAETKRVQRNPSPKLRSFRAAISDYTLFPKPIKLVVAENKPDDNDEIPVNGYYKLLNGEYYPANLFEKIQDSLEHGNDPMGEAIIRAAFKFPESLNITEHVFHLKGRTFSRESIFLGELNAYTMGVELTEVSNLTAKAYENITRSDLKSKFPGTLEYVQRVLNLRNIVTLADVPRSNVEILKLFKSLKQNELVQEILAKGLQLSIPSLDIHLLTGQCYDVLRDVVLPYSPYETNGMDTYVSDIGFKLPTSISSALTRSMEDVFHWYDSMEEYVQGRMSLLKVTGKLSSGLQPEISHGFNIQSNFNKSRTLTAAREYRIFELTIAKGAKLKDEFLKKVKEIPPFDRENHTIVDEWTAFFATYGTHVVGSSYGGGAIRITFHVKNESMGLEEAKDAAKTSITELFKFMDDIYLGKSLIKSDIDTNEVKYKLQFQGGSYQFQVSDFSKLGVDKLTNLMEGYQNSLEYEPAMLDSSMSLLPLSFILSRVDEEASFKVSNATVALLNATLTYVLPPPPLPPLERPEVKKHLQELNANLEAKISLLKQELKVAKDVFDKFQKEMTVKMELERKAAKLIYENRKKVALEDVLLNCFYAGANLTGSQVCTAYPSSCQILTMKAVSSVNTHGSCVQIFSRPGCRGNSFKHISNSTTNTKFPFSLPPGGGYFSVLDCIRTGGPLLKTLIVIVLDNSGSMDDYKNDVKAGFDGFIRDQRQITEDEAKVTLIKFDTVASTVYTNLPLAEVPPLNFNFDGGTALYDAIGEGIKAGERVQNSYDRVILVIMTDGDDNSSKNIKKNQIGSVIRGKENEGKWSFLYIGIDPEAWVKLTGMSVNNVATFSHVSQKRNFDQITDGVTNIRLQSRLQLMNAFKKN